MSLLVSLGIYSFTQSLRPASPSRPNPVETGGRGYYQGRNKNSRRNSSAGAGPVEVKMAAGGGASTMRHKQWKERRWT